jgi:1-acyl-sn-glycerol-3-phosphate acyltransferase
MMSFKFVRVIIHILVGVLTCATVFPFSSSAQHERMVRRWSKQLLDLCGIQLEVQLLHAPVQSINKNEQTLIVANHVSWVDVFALNAHHACHFVAKSDIRSWPIAGWLAAQAGTIFLARGKQREVRKIYEGLVSEIKNNQRIAFFPEGTTSSQGELLTFHANLFEAAIEAQVPVQPYAIRYLNQEGQYAHEVDFIGEMTLAESIKSILSSKFIKVQIIQLPLIETTDAHRRELAIAARSAIANALHIDEESESSEVSCQAA